MHYCNSDLRLLAAESTETSLLLPSRLPEHGRWVAGAGANDGHQPEDQHDEGDVDGGPEGTDPTSASGQSVSAKESARDSPLYGNI